MKNARGEVMIDTFNGLPAPGALWERLRFAGYDSAPADSLAELENTWGLLRCLSGVLSDLVDTHPAVPAPPALREADRAVHAAVRQVHAAVVEAQEARG